jgi:replicative DNA helicase
MGGIGSPKDPESWLYHYAKKTGLYEEIDETTRKDILTVDQVGNLFRTFAANIDKNRLEFGISELDRELDALVGRSYIIGGSPGCGKTSLALQIMNNTSMRGVKTIFFSFDMSLEDVFQKLIQKHFKINAKEVYDQAKSPERMQEFIACLQENYKNVSFIRSSGMTIDSMRKRIRDIERHSGDVKMVIVDYLDLVQSEFSDPTQKSMAVMQGLKSIGTDLRKCVIVLAQPNKANQKINQPVTSYSAIKGSGALGELANAVLWVHRPGASARGFENDKYYTIDCLKNRHGAMFNLDFSWEGVSGTIKTLTPEQRIQLEDLREQLRERDDNDI